jgi:K+-transporting ATPase KdpF subunit
MPAKPAPRRAAELERLARARRRRAALPAVVRAFARGERKMAVDALLVLLTLLVVYLFYAVVHPEKF